MRFLTYSFLLIPAIFGFGLANGGEVNKQVVVDHYAKLVYANYQDSLKTAQILQESLDQFIDEPSAATLSAAKKAWLVAREPYGQSEVFRFYSGPIDADDGPEGLLNAWPLDEAYIESSSGALKGIIQNAEKYPEISRELLVKLNEKEGEENISTGYHAIEFLLWGVDDNVDGPGKRPVTDYTTDPNADRRKAYLKAVTDQLLSDLKYLVDAWAPDKENYRADFVALDDDEALQNILNGIGMLSGFELARERVDVPLNSQSQEDEHSCFSDNTHNDILYNALAIQNAFEGRYKGVYFNVDQGPCVKSLFSNGDDLAGLIDSSVKLAKGLKAPFDQLIVESNSEGRESVKELVTSLSKQAKAISAACSAVGLSINISE